MDSHLQHFLAAIVRAKKPQPEETEVIAVSETASAAASAYETVRNTLEYDEEHLLRRNAIRRILKRRLAEEDYTALAEDLLRELIWARYLPNKQVPEKTAAALARIFAKYRPLFAALENLKLDPGRAYEWLLDVLSSELEYRLSPHLSDEALASFAYQELKARWQWQSEVVAEKDRDLQLYSAIHRAILKSNRATLRFRILTLFYPDWIKAQAEASVVSEIAAHLDAVIGSVERQIDHPAADTMFRLVRNHAVVFHLLRDVADSNTDTFTQAVEQGNAVALSEAITAAANVRYDRFSVRQRRGVFRAVSFLFLSKFILALLIELPYERLWLQTTNWLPLIANIVFHPTLLGIIGLSVTIPRTRNTAKILSEALAILHLGPDFSVPFHLRRPWSRGPVALIFRLLYAVFFFLTIGSISYALMSFGFNSVSIAFFLFFLSLVTFLGLKIRNTRRELVIVETSGNFLGLLIDILFLPIIRTGRWLSLHAPRINIFLFFFDFIIEAPFKAAIRLIEGWLAFLKEKKEEI